jgi:hypothetical protein
MEQIKNVAQISKFVLLKVFLMARGIIKLQTRMRRADLKIQSAKMCPQTTKYTGTGTFSAPVKGDFIFLTMAITAEQ